MKNYNISHDLICSIKGLYSNATSAVFNNGSIGEWFQASVGVRQGCLLSPTLFNIFLERIMTDALDGHAGTVSIGGRPLTNLRFADDIDGLAGSEEELRELLGRLEKASKDYGMEISGEKTKIMTNNINGMTTALHIAGNTLDEVQSFKYLGAIISEEGSKPEVLARIAQATAALSSLKKIWRDRNIPRRSKIRLLRSLVISVFLYACESWTLTADLQRRIQAMEMRCYRRLLNISYTEHITNVEVRKQNRACHWTIRRLAYYCQKKKAKMVWPCPQGLLVSQKRSCRVQSKAEGEGVARESDGKIISRIGLVYVLLNP